MEPKEISSLAKYFRNYGDKILTGDLKLSLTDFQLQALNKSFLCITDPNDHYLFAKFHVVKIDNSNTEFIQDLQLIYDFIQKTLHLRIFPQGINTINGLIDISAFRALEILEIERVDIKKVTGIQSLRSQLKNVICMKSIDSVEDIITNCGGDYSNAFAWNKLTSANFSFNSIKSVDNFLEFTYFLQELNLSHNRISSINAMKWLPNLKILDMSFNNLKEIPIFHIDACRNLEILILNNNYIENISGLYQLNALKELDLSKNCIMDHKILQILSKLACLVCVNFLGNPITFNAKHREMTVCYLHKNTTKINFFLNKKSVTKHEKKFVGKFTPTREFLLSMPSNSIQSSTLSLPTSIYDLQPLATGYINPNINNQNEANGSKIVIAKKPSGKRHRRKKIKTIDFEINKMNTDNDFENNSDSGLEIIFPAKNNLKSEKGNEESEIVQGINWLDAVNSDAINIYLGIINSSETKINFSSESKLQDILDEIKMPTSLLENINETENPRKIVSSSLNRENEIIINSEKETVDQSSENFSSNIYPSVKSETSTTYLTNNVEEDSNVSDSEDNEITYIVHTTDQTDELFLTVSNSSIKERNILTRKTITKWGLKILESCERIKCDTIRINFDTRRKDKQERVYTVGEGLCKELENHLRSILANRLLSEMNQTVYRCINCSSQFSRENTYEKRNTAILCPECECSYVIEVTDAPKENGYCKKPSDQFSSMKVEVNLSAIQGNPSDGSIETINESSCSKISCSQSSFDSNQSVAGSSVNDKELDLKFYQNYESDIEILSNPSQSSIEVLSSRKTSEERRIVHATSLETIHDNKISKLNFYNTKAPTNVNIISESTCKTKPNDDNNKKINTANNLTESSSSGSVTDSIITAYDHSEVKQRNKSSDKENKKDDSVLSTMFSGLFQSTNSLMSVSQKKLDISFDKFKYSYRDFSDVDHRLKFYFYQYIFEDEREIFKWLIKGKILAEKRNEMINGIIVMTNLKFYIMEITGPEYDDISKWLKCFASNNVDRIENAQLLPWKVGISFSIKATGCFILILQDTDRTESFLLFLENNPLPKTCNLNYQPSEKILKNLSNFTCGEQINVFSILNKCDITSESLEKLNSPLGFIITDGKLYLISDLTWLSTNSDRNIQFYHMQTMSNLVEITTIDENILLINYIDEEQDRSETWKCYFETEENANICLNSIAQSWQKLFGVSLLSN